MCSLSALKVSLHLWIKDVKPFPCKSLSNIVICWDLEETYFFNTMESDKQMLYCTKIILYY